MKSRQDWRKERHDNGARKLAGLVRAQYSPESITTGTAETSSILYKSSTPRLNSTASATRLRVPSRKFSSGLQRRPSATRRALPADVTLDAPGK